MWHPARCQSNQTEKAKTTLAQTKKIRRCSDAQIVLVSFGYVSDSEVMSPSMDFSCRKIFLALFNTISVLLLLISFPIILSKSSSSSVFLSGIKNVEEESCGGLDGFDDYATKCSYLQTHDTCVSQGYIDYIKLFYCIGNESFFLGFVILLSWLLALFYLLGNTASEYFCSTLEGLSEALGLSPTVAGVTLLSLGNGAPDFFSSIVSFTGSPEVAMGGESVGISSILGGAFFVSTAVVGVINIATPIYRPGSAVVTVDKSCFIRDICFLFLALAALSAILISGRIHLWEAILYVSIYIIYVVNVSTSFCCQRRDEQLRLPLILSTETSSTQRQQPSSMGGEEEVEIRSELLNYWFSYFLSILHILNLPFYLPRRMTIPLVSEEKWSKFYAVTSVTLSPLLLSALYSHHVPMEEGEKKTLEAYLIGGLIAAVLCIATLITTESTKPPVRFLLPWLASGFLMSVTWSYILAGELVSVVVSIGHILGINASILGLTVLAWGNSVGDLMTNVAMAMNGGEDGVQVAISGCYAGPLFNAVVGLGASFVLSAWNVYPSAFVLPSDDVSNFEIIGFLVSGILLAGVGFLRRRMKLGRAMGIGLICIYLCFLLFKSFILLDFQI